MSYDEFQCATQLLSLGIFASVLIAAIAYAFKRSNKQKFVEAATLAMRNDEINPSGGH